MNIKLRTLCAHPCRSAIARLTAREPLAQGLLRQRKHDPATKGAMFTKCAVTTLPPNVEEGINVQLIADGGDIRMEYGLCLDGTYPTDWIPVTVESNLALIVQKREDHKTLPFWSDTAGTYKWFRSHTTAKQTMPTNKLSA